ncbi:hypothetical protein NITLEN_10734 [Nitrospira lenta]|uniref:Uncharacterized protein n=1 Tax=Nitrospira lenta TaxID=1436998 RepID=A0A330L1L2_9BACT|nr:hypothetical protein NITLEN_10734 [Nitrospira lenta]
MNGLSDMEVCVIVPIGWVVTCLY